MNKITKRLLSILAVLALVLTMAPAGILAVETKAESQFTPGQANLPEGIADKQTAAAAKQAAAKAALAALEGTDAATRLAELNEELTTCPFCGKAATWIAPSTSASNAFGSGTHYYINGSFYYGGKNASAFVANADGEFACILLDNSKADLGGARIYMSKAASLNIGGTGSLYSSLNYVRGASSNYDTGVISLGGTGIHELNLYGGVFYTIRQATYKVNSKDYYHGTIFSCGANNAVNLWTDDVILGQSVLESTYGALNLYQTNGTTNIYAGTLRNGYSMIAYQGFNVFIGGTSSVNMYGGKITGGAGIANARGANVYIHDGGAFNMYGGEISGGKVTGTYAMGGNISSMAKSTAVINLQGGVVKNGSAPNGGNINVKLGSLTVGGSAAVTGGTANINGGNVYANAGSLVVDGTISGGWAKGTYAATNDNTKNPGGGNIYLTGGTLTVNGTVSGGRADTFGGNIFAMNGATVTVNGTIEQGTVNPDVPGYSTADPRKYNALRMGGAIYAKACTLTVNSTAKITDATARMYGGNIYLKEMVAANIGGEISGGYSLNGGNIAMEGGVATISGTVKDGTAEYGGNLMLMEGNKYSYPSTYDAENAIAYTLNISGKMLGGAMNSGSTYAQNILASNTFGKNSTITFSGDANVELGFYIVPSIKLILAEGWTGTGFVCTEAVLTAGDKIPTNEIVYQGTYAGKLSSVNGDEAVLVTTDEPGQLALPGYIVVGEETSVGYETAADAVTAYQEGEVLVAAGDVTVAGDMIIDPVTDITVSGTGKVYGIDRDNDNFDAWSGSITADGVAVAKEVTAGGRRYIALSDATVDANKYTFHRVEIELTNVTVNVDKAGIYYKAQYKFDEVVKGRVDSYGVLLKLNEAPTEESLATSSDNLDGYADATLVAASHGVYGIFKDGKESNLADGKTKVFGNPYLAINTTGEELEEYPMFTAAEAIGKSLADSMELANEKWDQLSADGQAALKAFVDKWNALGAWETDLIAKLTNFYPAEA